MHAEKTFSTVSCVEMLPHPVYQQTSSSVAFSFYDLFSFCMHIILFLAGLIVCLYFPWALFVHVISFTNVSFSVDSIFSSIRCRSHYLVLFSADFHSLNLSFCRFHPLVLFSAKLALCIIFYRFHLLVSYGAAETEPSSACDLD